MLENKEHPLVLVFKLDRELLADPRIREPFVESVNQMIEAKGHNIVAFFLPTDGEETIECLNPVLYTQPDMEKVYGVLDELATAFDIGKGA